MSGKLEAVYFCPKCGGSGRWHAPPCEHEWRLVESVHGENFNLQIYACMNDDCDATLCGDCACRGQDDVSGRSVTPHSPIVRAAARPYRVLLNRCLCYPCWAARCACGTWLTKHAFTEEDARAEAEDALSRTDRWGHSCEQSAQQSLFAEAAP